MKDNPFTRAQAFLILYREKGKELSSRDANAFILLTHIALRATRYDIELSLTPLKAGQAFVGDYKETGLTRAKYRSALKRLEQYGQIKAEPTNKGTIVTLISRDIYDINIENERSLKSNSSDNINQESIKKTSKSSAEINQIEPTISQQKTYRTPSTSHEETIQEPAKSHHETIYQPLTKNKTIQEGEEFNKAITTTNLPVGECLYPCLQTFEGTKGFHLTYEEKKSLMRYPVDRVIKAIEYASHPLVKIKKDLISTLHWHCKQEVPYAPPDESRTSSTNTIPQHALAFKYNELLRENGYLEQAEENTKMIPEGHAWIIEEGRWTTIGLNSNSLELVKKEFETSRSWIKKTRMHNSNQSPSKNMADMLKQINIPTPQEET